MSAPGAPAGSGTASLVEVAGPAEPAGVVLVLHGGASRRGDPPVSRTQLSVLRMIPVARRIARTGRDLAVLRLLNTTRGWGGDVSPVDDARWALGQVRERYGERPVVLVGHSLGGRAALVAGAEPGVVGVVALNPWLYPTDDVDLSGRRVLFVHGTDDRVASAGRARQVATRLGRRTDVEWRDVLGGKHAMLRHGRVFEQAAADFCAEVLDPARPAHPGGQARDDRPA